ncbi:ATP-binding protein [soil metagenome]
MPHLMVTRGPDAGKRFDLAAGGIIGRHSDCAVHLNDDRVSRRHCELTLTGNNYQLHDLGSGNGTRVNGQLLAAPHTLRPGDTVELGDTKLAFDPPALLLPPPDEDDARFRTRIVKSIPAADTSQIQVNLGVLYEAATAVSQILDIDELLGRVLDLVLNATDADHAGCLLQDTGTGELMPRVVRTTTRRSATPFAFSRTITEYVRREKQGILISDAAADDRFNSGESIVRHHLRDVIAVPMRGRHETVGVMILDTVTDATAKFTVDHLYLAIAVAHQAALAIEETRYYRALLDAERLAAIGQTIAGMSHHIKNIMQGVRFGGDMIRTGLAEDDKGLIGKGWNLVDRNQGRIDGLILDMLSYSKEREPLLEPTDLAKIVLDVVNMLQGKAAQRLIALTATVPESMPLVNCDGDGIHRAVLNVVTNALDAVEDVDEPSVTVDLKWEAEAMSIIVSDNGPGVPLEQREAIFQPFISNKGNRGTGLGLPVSRKTLREHGGDLTVENGPIVGARFVMRLPASPVC